MSARLLGGFFLRKYCDILVLPKIMWRAIRLLVLGIFCTALFLGAISVYIFHDVDKNKIGHWNEAFADLSIEAVVFSLIISGAVWLLALLGAAAFQSARPCPSRKNRSFSRNCSSSFPVSLRIRWKEARSKPRGVFSFHLFSRCHLPLYRCSPPGYIQATETPKSTRTSVDVPLIVTTFVLSSRLLSHTEADDAKAWATPRS